jgi:TPR repeat protein
MRASKTIFSLVAAPLLLIQTNVNASQQTFDSSNLCETDACVSQFKRFEMKRNVNNNNSNRLGILADMYLHGYGTEKDFDKASKLLRTVAKNARSNYHRVKFALLTLRESKNDKQIQIALKTLTRAADNGDSNASCLMSVIYTSDLYGQIDTKKAHHYKESALESGDFNDADFKTLSALATADLLADFTAMYEYSTNDINEYQSASDEANLLVKNINSNIESYTLNKQAGNRILLQSNVTYYKTTGAGPVPVGSGYNQRRVGDRGK